MGLQWSSSSTCCRSSSQDGQNSSREKLAVCEVVEGIVELSPSGGQGAPLLE
jgi:hypothetical protein